MKRKELAATNPAGIKINGQAANTAAPSENHATPGIAAGRNPISPVTPLINSRDVGQPSPPPPVIFPSETEHGPHSNPGRNPDGTFRPDNPYVFQPGQSGNPKGRPKGVRALTNRLRANMQRPCPGDPAGRTFGDVLMDNLALSAIRGDFKALLQVLDRVEGPPRPNYEKDHTHDAELWNRIASQLLQECDDNPDAKRAILAAVDKIQIDEED